MTAETTVFLKLLPSQKTITKPKIEDFLYAQFY